MQRKSSEAFRKFVAHLADEDGWCYSCSDRRYGAVRARQALQFACNHFHNGRRGTGLGIRSVYLALLDARKPRIACPERQGIRQPYCTFPGYSGNCRLVYRTFLDPPIDTHIHCVAVCCSVLQCVAVCCSVLQCVAVCCSVLQCVAVCCSVLQCAAVPSN